MSIPSAFSNVTAVAKANVDFVKKHGAELKKLEGLRPEDGCDGGDTGDEDAQ